MSWRRVTLAEVMEKRSLSRTTLSWRARAVQLTARWYHASACTRSDVRASRAPWWTTRTLPQTVTVTSGDSASARYDHTAWQPSSAVGRGKSSLNLTSRAASGLEKT